MPHQSFEISQWMCGRRAFSVDIVKHTSGPPRAVNSYRGHEYSADEKQDAGGLIGIPVFKQVAERAADEEGYDDDEVPEDVPHRADLPGHYMLLADRRS
jgi:hypothetical protein